MTQAPRQVRCANPGCRPGQRPNVLGAVVAVPGLGPLIVMRVHVRGRMTRILYFARTYARCEVCGHEAEYTAEGLA